MGVVPLLTARSRDIDTAARSNSVGQRQLIPAVLDCGGADSRVGTDRVAPGADFGDDDVRSIRRGPVGVNCGIVRIRLDRAIRGAIPLPPQFRNPSIRCGNVAEQRSAKSHGSLPERNGRRYGFSRERQLPTCDVSARSC